MQLEITRDELGLLRFAVSMAMDVVQGWVAGPASTEAIGRLEAFHQRLLDFKEKDNGGT